MSSGKGPGIDLEPADQPLADGTNALQPGRRPGISLDTQQEKPRTTGAGNPGRYLGIRQIRFTDGDRGWTTGQFHVIEAIRGTWLSAATRKFGWGEVYGPEHGYGAYVEGIVRGEDGRPVAPWHAHRAADLIEPGDLFAIEIYRAKTKRKPKGGAEGGELSGEQEQELRPVDPTIGTASALGLGVEVAGNIFAPLGIFSIPFNLIAVSRSPDVAMAQARANCYARTAFIYRQHEAAPLPISSVYDRLEWREELYERAKTAWRDTWSQTTADAKNRFKQEYKRIYMEVSRNGGKPMGELQLREALKNITAHKHGTPARYCEKLMKETVESNVWTDSFPATVRPLWEADMKTKYPD